MSIGTSVGLGLAVAGGIGAAGSVASSVIGAKAAGSAANKQVSAEQQALAFQQQVYGDQKGNQAPFIQGGQQSLAQLMAALSNGTFGPGSLGPVPTAPGAFTGTFSAPTLEDARNTPGYQFTQSEGEKGIERGAAAAGGAIGGGTLKALAKYDTGLADSTYNDVFNRSLATFGTGLSSYNANLQGYQSQLAEFAAKGQAQQQAFNQLISPIQIGESASANAGATGSQFASTIGNTFGQIGNAQAAGIVGQANAITGGIGGATGAASNALTLPYFLQALKAGQGNKSGLDPSYNDV